MISVGEHPNNVIVDRKRVMCGVLTTRLSVGKKYFRGMVISIEEHHRGHIVTVQYKDNMTRLIYVEPPSSGCYL